MQKNHDRAIVQESVLPAPSDLSPRPGRAFTFITRSLCLQALARKRVSAAPFRSRNYWTPRSVFRDGSNSEGSPSAPLSRVGYWNIGPSRFDCLHRPQNPYPKPGLPGPGFACSHHSREPQQEKAGRVAPTHPPSRSYSYPQRVTTTAPACRPR